MNSCVFPGSFDPVTAGHLDLIRRAARLFGRVTVTVMINVNKKGTLPVGERIRILRKACADLENVRIDRWDGLLSEYMRIKGERIVLRGARSFAEFEQEFNSAQINRKLNADMETLLIPSDPALSFVSSSAVRELASFGGDIGPWVPESVRKDIQEALSKNIPVKE